MSTCYKQHHEYSGYLPQDPNRNEVLMKLAKPIILEKQKVENNVNSVFSPLSLHVVLGMIAAASEDGQTRDAILHFLKSKFIDELNSLCSMIVNHILLDDSFTGGPILSTANGIWKATPLPGDYNNVLKNVYKAHFSHADFQNKAYQVAREVNEWVEKETKGHIKNILPPGAVNEHSISIIANALYFNGAWEETFDASQTTKNRKFYISNGETVKASFMSSHYDQFISAYDGFKVLRLPYRQGEGSDRRFSMYLYLPDAIDGLPGLVNRISSEPKFFEHYDARKLVQVGDFLIPKFKISYGFEASDILKDSGMVFPSIDKHSIFHESFIEVDEKGTEAAGATVYLNAYDSIDDLPPRPKERLDFVADHPFIFLIKEDVSGVILFVGSVLNSLDSNQD